MSSPTSTPDARFYCESCCFRATEAGDCPACKEDVLLDLENEDVRLMLHEMDRSAMRRRTAMLGSIGALTAIPITAALGAFAGSGRGLAVVWLGLALGLGFLLDKLFGLKPRHPV